MTINDYAKLSYDTAIKRKKIKNNSTPLHHLNGIMKEDIEFIESIMTPCKSEHLKGYSGAEEEAIDGIIARLTFLRSMDVNVEKLLIAKLKYNLERNG